MKTLIVMIFLCIPFYSWAESSSEDIPVLRQCIKEDIELSIKLKNLNEEDDSLIERGKQVDRMRTYLNIRSGLNSLGASDGNVYSDGRKLNADISELNDDTKALHREFSIYREKRQNWKFKCAERSFFRSAISEVCNGDGSDFCKGF